MNRPILSCWIDYALELEEDKRELQTLMTNLLVAIARNREVLEYARGEIKASFPEEKAA